MRHNYNKGTLGGAENVTPKTFIQSFFNCMEYTGRLSQNAGRSTRTKSNEYTQFSSANRGPSALENGEGARTVGLK